MPIYKDNKRGTWYFRIYVTNKNGNRVQKTKSGFKSKTACKEAESKFLLNHEEKNDDILFSDLYNVYIKNKEQSLKFQSFRSLKNRFESNILPFFKDYSINKIKASDFIEWKAYIIDKKYSYSYNSSLYRAIVNILNFANTFYDLENNIAKKIGNFSKKDYKPNVNFWTLDEFNRFISHVNDIVYYSLFDLLYYTGLRLGEALALNWNDLQGNYIDINKTLIRKSVNDCRFNSPKSISSIRKVKIDDYVLSNLTNLKSYYKNFINFNNDWFIFGGIKPLATTTVERYKNNYCKLANVKQIRNHDFRHSHATLLLSKGVPITVISKRLGHSNISMTLNKYSHLIPEDEDKAINLLYDLKSKK